MLKSILNLEGVQQLNKTQQNEILGGIPNCQVRPCPPGLCCHPNGHCCDPMTDANC